MPTKNLLASNLIILDGLPGSGKSTTGQWLTSQLLGHRLNVRWLPETDVSHPLWWYDYWNGTTYLKPDFDHIPIATFLQTSLNKWKDFDGLVSSANQCYVVESVLFQNAVAMFLMGGAMPEMLVEYAQDVQKIIRGLDPILIYFRQNDVAAALRKICALRGREFEDELIHNMEQFPYLSQRKLKGLDGVTTLWRDIYTMTNTLFDEYTISKLVIETSQANWHSYRQQILEFLGLPPEV